MSRQPAPASRSPALLPDKVRGRRHGNARRLRACAWAEEIILGISHKPVTRCYRIRTFFEFSGGERDISAYSPEECASTTGEAGDVPLIVAVYPAWAKEGVDDTIDFEVHLSREAESQVQVRYFTQDVTAKAGEHYQSKSGTVTFSAGQTSKTIPVTLSNDLEDDPYKTFTMRINNVTDAGAEIAWAVGLGSITNSETYPLAGFLLVDAETGSVRLELTGAKTASRRLNAEPWSLYGDDGGDLQGESLPAGSYTLMATVYPEADLGGDTVQTLSVSFTVATTAGDNNPATG